MRSNTVSQILSTPTAPKPDSVEALQALLKESLNSTWIPCGGGTKGPMSYSLKPSLKIDLRGMSGIVDYQPSDFTVTVLSGTSVASLQQELDKHGQFLPFDPPWVKQGSTVGGMVAGGINGPCRLIWGGLRDFLLEVEFLNGTGTLVRGGARVVKNTAGFDLPKFMVGSAGRFGIMTKITLKVFPKPHGFMTTKIPFAKYEHALTATRKLANLCLDVIAADIDSSHSLHLRFAGDASSNAASRDRVFQTLQLQPAQLVNTESFEGEQDLLHWDNLRDQPIASLKGDLWRISCSPSQSLKIVAALNRRDGVAYHVTQAGNSIWLDWVGDLREIDVVCKANQAQAMLVRGKGSWRLLGHFPERDYWSRIANALDPQQRFLPMPSENAN